MRRTHKDFPSFCFDIVDHFLGEKEPYEVTGLSKRDAETSRRGFYRFATALNRDADKGEEVHDMAEVARDLKIEIIEGDDDNCTLRARIHPMSLHRTRIGTFKNQPEEEEAGNLDPNELRGAVLKRLQQG